MAVILKTVVFASIFVSLTFILLPSRILALTGVTSPVMLGWQQYTGMVLGAAGAALGLWCVGAFALIGKGTPAPIDPPRNLVVRGPYRFVRNPMYISGVFVLSGTALYFGSLSVFLFACALLLISHLFVQFKEEPSLRNKFGSDYESYCSQVHRWLPSSGAGLKE
ncbi:MAG: isoprenylcysteine carboxylmethyltransferase family protein [Acidobacteriota bacterium]|nr:isoprenylcysteine carboxylmethyltransferase family protein [Acidobacteriota bacterium]